MTIYETSTWFFEMPYSLIAFIFSSLLLIFLFKTLIHSSAVGAVQSKILQIT